MTVGDPIDDAAAEARADVPPKPQPPQSLTSAAGEQELIAHAAGRAPEAPALACAAGRLDYAGLHQQVEDFAACLAGESRASCFETLRLTRELIDTLGMTMEGDEGVARAVGDLVDRRGDRDATLRSLDRAFGFYDAVLSRAASEETLFLAQRLAQVSLDRIGILREGDNGMGAQSAA